MKHLDSVKAGLVRKLAFLRAESNRISKVLDALDLLSDPKPKSTKKERRVRHVRYKVACQICGNTFTARRTPNGKNPDRIPKFCHKPCNSTLWIKKQKESKLKLSRKGTTLLPGDPLSAATSH